MCCFVFKTCTVCDVISCLSVGFVVLSVWHICLLKCVINNWRAITFQTVLGSITILYIFIASMKCLNWIIVIFECVHNMLAKLFSLSILQTTCRLLLTSNQSLYNVDCLWYGWGAVGVGRDIFRMKKNRNLPAPWNNFIRLNFQNFWYILIPHNIC